MQNSMNVMQREPCVYKIPAWVDIRKVTTKEDYKAYCSIYLDTFGITFGRRVALWLNKNQIYLRSYIWFYHGEYIGIYALKDEESIRVTTNVNFRVLYNFAIVANKRGRGFAKMLLASAITNTAKQGCQELLLSVMVDNIKAVNLYRQFDFTFINTQKEKED